MLGSPVRYGALMLSRRLLVAYTSAVVSGGNGV
jgi:hypothetical protein